MPKKVIEHFYMMSVAMYIYDYSSLVKFMFVSKKCKSAASTLKVNPNFQDTEYYRRQMTLKQRVDLFKKELKLFDSLDTLRGSFTIISSFFESIVDKFDLFDLYYEGCGQLELFKKIQPQITQLEFICNGRFEGIHDMPLLKTFKVTFLPQSVNTNELNSIYVKVLCDYINNNTMRNLEHFILIVYDIAPIYLPLIQLISTKHPSCQIGICVKNNVTKDQVINYLNYVTVISTSKDALFYGSVENDLKVIATQF